MSFACLQEYNVDRISIWDCDALHETKLNFHVYPALFLLQRYLLKLSSEVHSVLIKLIFQIVNNTVSPFAFCVLCCWACLLIEL